MIKHLDGVCHVYIDDHADLDKAIRIADNAKTQRYGVCNAMETLLVAQSVAAKVLPPLAKIYLDKGVELRGDEAARALVTQMKAATEEDWHTEYLAPILAVRVVAGLDEAIEHITTYGSQHTDSIVTENYTKAMRFLREVDSSSVMVNASTRFADGFEYGLGAEIGISTDKLHARGPVGLEGLTSQEIHRAGQRPRVNAALNQPDHGQNNKPFFRNEQLRSNHSSQSAGHRRFQGRCGHRNIGQGRRHGRSRAIADHSGNRQGRHGSAQPRCGRGESTQGQGRR